MGGLRLRLRHARARAQQQPHDEDCAGTIKDEGQAPADLAQLARSRMDEQGAKDRDRNMQPHPSGPRIALKPDIHHRQAEDLDGCGGQSQQHARGQQPRKAVEVKAGGSGNGVQQRSSEQRRSQADPVSQKAAKGSAKRHGQGHTANQLLDEHGIARTVGQIAGDARQDRVDRRKAQGG